MYVSDVWILLTFRIYGYVAKDVGVKDMVIKNRYSVFVGANSIKGNDLNQVDNYKKNFKR